MSGLLDAWLAEVVSTPGLTALRDVADARRRLLDDSVAGRPLVETFDGPVVDVGSGNGAPGIPLAVELPEREFILLEASRRKCDFLERWAARLPNVTVVHGRAEEQSVEAFGLALAKALAPPPVAAEWCLPLVHEGGGAILWIGASADVEAVRRAAGRLAADVRDTPPGFVVLAKTGPTPPGFPRRPGMARKRPLA
ncbi:MAG TPA: 16S rRNA (guanine(527)-N(7))-methyltransferase RsmG [Gaiellaceae bacterium]|nr:16S rRNA (guanine(527)-N(7))-methyltransferase RsmG [Gaiellaceae bacterium]